MLPHTAHALAEVQFVCAVCFSNDSQNPRPFFYSSEILVFVFALAVGLHWLLCLTSGGEEKGDLSFYFGSFLPPCSACDLLLLYCVMVRRE